MNRTVKNSIHAHPQIGPIQQEKRGRKAYLITQKNEWNQIRSGFVSEREREMARRIGIARSILNDALRNPSELLTHLFEERLYSVSQAKTIIFEQLHRWVEDFNSSGVPLLLWSIQASYRKLGIFMEREP